MDLSCKTYSSWKGPEDPRFTMTVRNKYVKIAPASLKIYVGSLPCRSAITVKIFATVLRLLNAAGGS